MDSGCWPSQDCLALRHTQIPSSEAPSLSSAAQQSQLTGWRCPSSWQSHQSVWVSCWNWAVGMAPSCCCQHLQTHCCGYFTQCPQCEELPTCMSFIPSCGKVNKAYKEENVLPRQPFLLHFFYTILLVYIFLSKL